MYEKFKREYPTDVTYTKQKLQRNIRSVLSIAFKSIPKTQIIGSTYEQWDAKGYKEIRFKNWFFAVTLEQGSDGCIYAVIQDGHHNSLHHNDQMQTQPYDNIDECIRYLLREYANRNYPITESKSKGIIRMNEQGLRRMAGYIVRRINEDAVYNPIRTLNEKFYNPKKESMIDGKLGDYDVLDGALYRKIVEDLKDKGWVEDVRMYANPKKGGKTYALYRRCDNHKYFWHPYTI
jgi:hypothetical protein